MAKNDFDMDFDFEKEYGFDPKAILDSEFSDADLDLSDFADDLGLDLEEKPGKNRDFDDFDLDSLKLGDDLTLDLDIYGDAPRKAESASEEPELDVDLDLDFDEEPRQEAEDEDLFEEEEDVFEPEAEDDYDEPLFDEDDFDEDEDLTLDMDFSHRASFFEEAPSAPEVPEEPVEFTPEDPELPIPEDQDPTGDLLNDAGVPKPQKPVRNSRRKAESKPKEKREPIKITVPPVLIKFVKLYFPTAEEINPKAEEDGSGRRRRRKSKIQIFKEFYLPTIIAGLAIVVILSFLIGSLGNAIDRKRLNDEAAAMESMVQESEAARVEAESQVLLERAAELAAGYNYKAAIDLLNSFSGNPEDFKDISTMKSEYMTAMSQLIEYKDPSTIPNLSFHILIADTERAFADKEYGGLYNRNFVTIGEFQKILEQLYKNNYVLVDFDSFVTQNEGSFFSQSIFLPEGKKPVMITETMVNYFEYMVDSNSDHEPDGGGDGFASKLVVTATGEIKAELVDANNMLQVGDYDLVPILETFIAEHPDFSYQGARATLAVCGYEGVFGYRTDSSYVPTLGQSYVDAEIAGAKQLVQALRDKGYTIACYTYGNKAYLGMTAAQIQAEMSSWTSQVTPVLGEVDTIVFARESDIGDYTGGKFDVLYNTGFRFFVKNTENPQTEITTTFVRQGRLMVTGNAMAWKSNLFTNLFDPNVVLDLTARGGSVPNG